MLCFVQLVTSRFKAVLELFSTSKLNKVRLMSTIAVFFLDFELVRGNEPANRSSRLPFALDTCIY
jgi:hypothetical protein